MTTQAITDIKELVGEMPARGCECGIVGCNGERHQNGCGRRAVWAVRVHGKNRSKHGEFVIALCDECLQRAKEIKTFVGNCRTCGESWPLLVMPL